LKNSSVLAYKQEAARGFYSLLAPRYGIRDLLSALNYETILHPFKQRRGTASSPFLKGRLRGIYLKIHPNPPLRKEGTASSPFKQRR